MEMAGKYVIAARFGRLRLREYRGPVLEHCRSLTCDSSTDSDSSADESGSIAASAGKKQGNAGRDGLPHPL
eukprot:scaffold235191_cov36-Tisochrysis_lutea.AAC.2